MRLIFISLGTLLIVGLMWGIAHFWGLSQVYVPFESPFFAADLNPKSNQNPIQSQSSNSASAATTQSSTSATPITPMTAAPKKWVVIPWEQNYFLEKIPDAILWADVYRGEADLLLVKPWVERNKPNRQLEKKSTSTRPLLTDLLTQYSKARFVLNITDNVEQIHEQVANIIEQTKASGRVIITSPYPVVINSIKDLKPMELYTNSSVDFVKMNFFEALKLLPAMPFKYDIFFGPLMHRNTPIVTKDMVIEIRRRHKKVLIGPIGNAEGLAKAKEVDADGYFLADPILWSSSIDTNK